MCAFVVDIGMSKLWENKSYKINLISSLPFWWFYYKYLENQIEESNFICFTKRKRKNHFYDNDTQSMMMNNKTNISSFLKKALSFYRDLSVVLNKHNINNHVTVQYKDW